MGFPLFSNNSEGDRFFGIWIRGLSRYFIILTRRITFMSDFKRYSRKSLRWCSAILERLQLFCWASVQFRYWKIQLIIKINFRSHFTFIPTLITSGGGKPLLLIPLPSSSLSALSLPTTNKQHEKQKQTRECALTFVYHSKNRRNRLWNETFVKFNQIKVLSTLLA